MSWHKIEFVERKVVQEPTLRTLISKDGEPERYAPGLPELHEEVVVGVGYQEVKEGNCLSIRDEQGNVVTKSPISYRVASELLPSAPWEPVPIELPSARLEE